MRSQHVAPKLTLRQPIVSVLHENYESFDLAYIPSSKPSSITHEPSLVAFQHL